MIPISQWMDETKGGLHNQFYLYIHIDTCSYILTSHLSFLPIKFHGKHEDTLCP